VNSALYIAFKKVPLVFIEKAKGICELNLHHLHECTNLLTEQVIGVI
jgi:hypothetical protein